MPRDGNLAPTALNPKVLWGNGSVLRCMRLTSPISTKATVHEDLKRLLFHSAFVERFPIRVPPLFVSQPSPHWSRYVKGGDTYFCARSTMCLFPSAPKSNLRLAVSLHSSVQHSVAKMMNNGATQAMWNCPRLLDRINSHIPCISSRCKLDGSGRRDPPRSRPVTAT